MWAPLAPTVSDLQIGADLYPSVLDSEVSRSWHVVKSQAVHHPRPALHPQPSRRDRQLAHLALFRHQHVPFRLSYHATPRSNC